MIPEVSAEMFQATMEIISDEPLMLLFKGGNLHTASASSVRSTRITQGIMLMRLSLLQAPQP